MTMNARHTDSPHHGRVVSFTFGFETRTGRRTREQKIRGCATSNWRGKGRVAESCF